MVCRTYYLYLQKLIFRFSREVKGTSAVCLRCSKNTSTQKIMIDKTTQIQLQLRLVSIQYTPNTHVQCYLFDDTWMEYWLPAVHVKYWSKEALSANIHHAQFDGHDAV